MTIEQVLQAGLEHHQAGRLAEAEAIYRRVLAIAPRQADALHLLGLLAHQAGRNQTAAQLIDQAIGVRPHEALYWNNLGRVLRAMGQVGRSVDAHRRAVELNPGYLDAMLNLASSLVAAGRADQSLEWWRKALEIRGDLADAWRELGSTLRKLGQLDAAAEALSGATAMAPGDAAALVELGSVHHEQGRIERALECYRAACELRPDWQPARSNYLYALQFSPEHDAGSILREHQAWARQCAAPLEPAPRNWPQSRDPDRRIRVGYVSANFKSHVVSVFFGPILANHDRGAFEIYCYSDTGDEDAVTLRLRGYPATWRQTRQLGDPELAELVREDRIDILVDLTQHTADGRLLMFARRSAPVQVSYLGYAGTTGLSTMDWRISDPNLDPPGREHHDSERLARLPECYWCYRPAPDMPEVSPPPACAGRPVVLGSLNSFAKVNARVIDAWGRILRRTGDARLEIFITGGEANNASVRRRIESEGLDPRRFSLVDRMKYKQYLEYCSRIDMALDPFPYNGGTTTLDALWMGLPVVTLEGDRPVARAGATLLRNVGLPELVARDVDEYVELACGLARDPDRLASLRRQMRDRMMRSPLMDSRRFVRNLEALYRGMWREFCGHP